MTENVKMKKQKAQASLEFMIFVGLAVLILAIFTILMVMYLNSIQFQREKITAERTIKNIKNEIATASRVENGYVRHLSLPQTINGWDYTLSFEKRHILLTFDESAEQGSIILGLSADIENSNPPDDIISFEPETNSEIVISKLNDVVYVCSLQEYNENGRCL